MLCALFFRTGTVFVENPCSTARGIHRRFLGIEWRSIPLPISMCRSQFGIVFCKTYWQALFRIGPFMVELFAVEGFAFDRRMSHIRSRLSPVESSPRQPG